MSMDDTQPGARTRHYLSAALFAIAGLINAYPVVGVLGAGQLQSLYGTTVSDPDLLLLLRHRAIVLGLLGLLLIAAAASRRLRTLALGAGLASMLSFVALALPLSMHGAAMARIAWADLIASALLLCAAFVSPPPPVARRSAPPA
jgi:hypothetical protein